MKPCISEEEKAGREEALRRRLQRTEGVKPGQLFWERNGIDNDSSERHGSIVLVIDRFSTIYSQSGIAEHTFLVLVTEADGRVYTRQGHRFIISFDDGHTDRLSW